MNKLYQELIEGISPEAKISIARRGAWRSYVEWEQGAGVASLLLESHHVCYPNVQDFPEWTGKPLRDLAACIESNDNTTRALACAALTAFYNTHEHLSQSNCILYSPGENQGDVFRTLEPQCKNKIVGTIGHFHGGETLQGMKELRVFEKDPRPGDYSEKDEETLLPGCDIVVITGMAITNGTMEHMLELSQNAYVALSGPSVPITDIWFRHGVNALFGTFIWDIDACREMALEDSHKSTWQHMGKVVKYK